MRIPSGWRTRYAQREHRRGRRHRRHLPDRGRLASTIDDVRAFVALVPAHEASAKAKRPTRISEPDREHFAILCSRGPLRKTRKLLMLDLAIFAETEVSMRRVLVVDDEENIRLVLKTLPEAPRL